MSLLQQRHCDDHVKRRAAHVLVAFRNKLYLWGGYMEETHDDGYDLNTLSSTSYHNSDEVWVYEPLIDTWTRKICKGDIPVPLSGACAAVHDDKMYLFGGYNSEHPNDGYYASLWRLNLTTFVWELLSPKGFTPLPCDKSSSWVYRDRFYIFGGFGPTPLLHISRPTNFNFEREVADINRRSWLGQLCYYDTKKDLWTWPKCNGLPPMPRAAHTAAVLEDNVYVFGGRHKNKRLNDLYCLHLPTHTWSQVIYSDPTSPVPEGRSWHTLDAISEDKLLLYGGFSTNCEVFNDLWIFDASSTLWHHMHWLSPKPRLWHKAALLSSGELVCIGGVSNNLLDYTTKTDHAEEMLFLRFTPPSLFTLSMEYICQRMKSEYWQQLPCHLRNILYLRTDEKQMHSF